MLVEAPPSHSNFEFDRYRTHTHTDERERANMYNKRALMSLMMMIDTLIKHETHTF